MQSESRSGVRLHCAPAHSDCLLGTDDGAHPYHHHMLLPRIPQRHVHVASSTLTVSRIFTELLEHAGLLSSYAEPPHLCWRR